MPLCNSRSSASVAGGLVGALHVFLCFFHADFCQKGEQWNVCWRVVEPKTSHLRAGLRTFNFDQFSLVVLHVLDY